MSDNNELGILARRKIEAEIIKPIYEILVREIGKTRAQAVIGEAIEQAKEKIQTPAPATPAPGTPAPPATPAPKQ